MKDIYLLFAILMVAMSHTETADPGVTMGLYKSGMQYGKYRSGCSTRYLFLKMSQNSKFIISF